MLKASVCKDTLQPSFENSVAVFNTKTLLRLSTHTITREAFQGTGDT